MAAKGTSSVKSRKASWGFIRALASAVLEWLLLFMLFIDAIFSYLITRFASYCELQTPCLLCSRLDHVLGHRKRNNLWDLICGNHKLEISSLVLCQSHNKLVDVHGMCESCLFSFATINKSNSETYRLLVGKLGDNSRFDIDEDPLLEGHNIGHACSKQCSCCNEPWSSREYKRELMKTKSITSHAEVDMPLSAAPLYNQDDLKKRSDNLSVLAGASHVRNKVIDPLSHIGYTELKIESDSESDILSSDDNDASAPICETHASKEDLGVCVQQDPHLVTLSDDLASEKLIDPVSVHEPSVLISQVQSEVVEPDFGAATEPTVATGHGLEEINWQQVNSKADPSAPTELFAIDDLPPSSRVGETPGGVLTESKHANVDVPPASDASEMDFDVPKESKLSYLNEFIRSSNATESPTEASKESCIAKAEDARERAVSEHGEICKSRSGPITTTETATETNPLSNNTTSVPNLLDLSDAYKLAVGNKGRQLSGVLAEQLIGKDSSRVSEELMLLLSQLSVSRGFEQSMTDMSPRLSMNSDGSKTPNASSSSGMQILQKRISLERNESGFESLDGSIVSEIEGESVIERLKRQVEHDRKLLTALYKELEEERNASTVAVNQAMAMITRLQEEKATLHMEALQNLRMMEEQAEYDMEALQKTNELLAEKEKEIQDLEAELEFYRKKVPNESTLENAMEATSNLRAKEIRVDPSGATCIQTKASVPRNSNTEGLFMHDESEETDMSFVNMSKGTANNLSSSLDFKDEKLYILQCLNKLENKFHMFTNKEIDENLANGGYHGNEGRGISNLESSTKEEVSKLNNGMEGNQLLAQNDESGSKGNQHVPETVTLSEKPQLRSKEDGAFDYSAQSSPVLCSWTDLASVEDEVSNLHERLEALEADQSLLEHAINSLKNGEEGLQFIREIASHLQELRRIGIRTDQGFA